MPENSTVMVKNVMETLVWNSLENVLDNFPNACKCNICKCDIAAIALNNLTPKYVATEIGEIYSKTEILENQYRADVISAITRAIIRVMQYPRCNVLKKVEV